MIISLVLAILLGLLLLSPTFSYLWGVWRRRREEILTAFTQGCIEKYRETFFPTLIRVGDETTWMESRYDSEFGRRRYLVPGLFLFGLGTLSAFLIAEALRTWSESSDFQNSILPPIGLAALTGAYAWVFLNHVGRWRRGDLLPVDIAAACVRFVIAIPLGYALAPFASEEFGFAIAFLAGAFPTRSLTTLSRRLVWQQLNVDAGGGNSESELIKLQGIRRPVAERLADEGVSSIAQLAYEDPIDLSVRTSYPFSFIVDLVSQSLAWIYLEDSLAKLRSMTFRGGQEIYSLIAELENTGTPESNAALATIKAGAKAIEIDEAVFERMLKEIALDPHTQFLVDIWHSETADDPGVAEPHLTLSVDAVNEIVTIVNEGGSAIDTVGWSVRCVDGDRWYEFADSRILEPGDSVEVRSGPDAEEAADAVVWTRRHEWRDRKGHAQLVDPNGYVFAESFW